ncbi:C40 family peptidase [[Clostridium] fimetarium]|uniref:NlpC/P60 family protein n=1 Tax=[Clostridium] fimetarium TaxID=99656 RepID=A0A1I0NHJ8_9FIRM|nr:NlpC/P60 family protein [[Clostridium] fimetarium]SEW00591.1 NlpC/P60 family protein [[Clostridium] fimetarium]
MKIKKVDEKPMVIHTKADTKLHVHQMKDAALEGQNFDIVDHSPKIKDGQINQAEVKKSGKERYRKSSRRNIKESKKSIKVNNSLIKLAAVAGASAATNQMEGDEEVRQSALITATLSKPGRDAVRKGSELFRQKIMAERKRKIKKVEAGKKLAKRGIKKTAANTTKKVVKETTKKTSKVVAKETAKVSVHLAGTVAGTTATGPAGLLIGVAAGKAVGWKMDKGDVKRTNRNRKIMFFMDKMKSKDDQTDSIGKMVKDLILKRGSLVMKKIVAVALPALLAVFLLMAIVCIPVILVVAVIYNSPFAIFFPPLSDGDTVMTVTSQYVAEFNRDTSTFANDHTGYDTGTIVYVDYEGSNAVPSNYYDIMCVYMVKFGGGDTATVMKDTSKERLKGVFDDMCSYTTTTGTETIENDDGTTSTKTVLYVNITLKTFRKMETQYNFSVDEIKMLEAMMSPEDLARIGYTGGSGAGGNEGSNAVSVLSQTQIETMVSGITDAKAKATCSFVLSKVGYPYSQDYRDTGNYYDCSSLAYYSWKAAGVEISFGGATSAAAEGQGLDEDGKTVSADQMQPGDLVFYSYLSNGRYKNISHVAIYVGNGKTVEALNESVGVVYKDVSTGSIVMVARP